MAKTDGFRENAGDKLIHVVKAETPQAEVERLFGKPDRISDSPDGKRWMYVTGYSKAIFVAFDSNDNVKAVDRLPKDYINPGFVHEDTYHQGNCLSDDPCGFVSKL